MIAAIVSSQADAVIGTAARLALERPATHMPPTANGEIRPTVARDADEQGAKRIRHDGGKLYKFLQARQASLR